MYENKALKKILEIENLYKNASTIL